MDEKDIKRLAHVIAVAIMVTKTIVTIMNFFGAKREEDALVLESEYIPLVFCKALRLTFSANGISYLVFAKPGVIKAHEMGHVALLKLGIDPKSNGRDLPHEIFADLNALKNIGLHPMLRAYAELNRFNQGARDVFGFLAEKFGKRSSLGQKLNTLNERVVWRTDMSDREIAKRRSFVVKTAFGKIDQNEVKAMFHNYPEQLLKGVGL